MFDWCKKLVVKAETLLMNKHARVLFFATLREKAGRNEISIEFPEGSRISDIKNLVLEKYPDLNQYIETMIVALNHEFAFDNDLVPSDAEIAMFPPVSGGEANNQAKPTLVAIVDDEININQVLTAITSPTTGATCVFTGTVREETRRGKLFHTEHLEYEAYRTMAEGKLKQIADEIRSRWSEIEGIALVQRIGLLMPGMISVAVACSAAHRDMGIFDSAHYGIDRLKEIVPIWKKEVSPSGEEWIEGKYIPKPGE
jgi:molybdopterin converting factor subunit 1